mmetsp:Transcript_10056/g.26825  ORF Transcript_10056/g.26825 Transcript_10056/m.26825 type:complete len:223 (-) Transcript_10056:833-1501(-)
MEARAAVELHHAGAVAAVTEHHRAWRAQASLSEPTEHARPPRSATAACCGDRRGTAAAGPWERLQGRAARGSGGDGWGTGVGARGRAWAAQSARAVPSRGLPGGKAALGLRVRSDPVRVYASRGAGGQRGSDRRRRGSPGCSLVRASSRNSAPGSAWHQEASSAVLSGSLRLSSDAVGGAGSPRGDGVLVTSGSDACLVGRHSGALDLHPARLAARLLRRRA